MVPDYEAYQLIQRGAEALSRVEASGIRIDTDYLQRAYTGVDVQIKDLLCELKSTDVYTLWSKRFGSRTKLGSGEQLAKILFGDMGFEPTEYTETGKVSSDEKHLSTVDHPFVQKYLKHKQLIKLRDTYLIGVLSEVCDGFLHPNINLNLAQTYRSSSSKPNFQNIPVRNKSIAKIIRSAFIPRDGHVLLEIDYGQIEVRVSACYHHDPTMLDYIIKKGDMHLDMAAELFLLPIDQITKEMRQVAKGSFVFAEFYGDYYPSVTRGIWESLLRDEVKYQGRPIFEHFKQNAIKARGACNPKQHAAPGTFENHVKEVEQHFWNERFPVYRDWKNSWYNEYVRRGCYKMLTGFVGRGVYKRNEVINAPIQGSAFHCLLWSLIESVSWSVKNKMRSRVVGQIHDSILWDAHLDELGDVWHTAKAIMTENIRREWSWITVPLEVDAGICYQNWFEKQEYA